MKEQERFRICSVLTVSDSDLYKVTFIPVFLHSCHDILMSCSLCKAPGVLVKRLSSVPGRDKCRMKSDSGTFPAPPV